MDDRSVGSTRDAELARGGNLPFPELPRFRSRNDILISVWYELIGLCEGVYGWKKWRRTRMLRKEMMFQMLAAMAL